MELYSRTGRASDALLFDNWVTDIDNSADKSHRSVGLLRSLYLSEAMSSRTLYPAVLSNIGRLSEILLTKPFRRPLLLINELSHRMQATTITYTCMDLVKRCSPVASPEFWLSTGSNCKNRKIALYRNSKNNPFL